MTAYAVTIAPASMPLQGRGIMPRRPVVPDRDVHSAVVRWVASKVGLPPGSVTIKGQESGDLPVAPFAMVTLTGTDEVRDHPMDFEYEEHLASDPDRVLTRPIIEMEWQFSVHVYGGPSPTDALRPVRSASHVTQAIEPLMPSLVVHEVSMIRNIPELLEGGGWEKRAQMDLYVRGLTRDGQIIDVIEEYEFDFERM